ncbi:uncharacterized protein AMSG_11024 [Thecamonas trahens ATCC 50062]|uniref:Uncharacterized protein n=1 Tax=Thecamonas trahens ATCC 50062 TaxID=461836 RepID=A0A0L0DV14_THETB|nr:hypothetical protein AMSG_11024 [Thecamonas trahens ATCC 50062]KNC55368.1 hypothetical protein AMSG_11024 [Thecamonas trahens ATCC 50062]|eukprot:XP_013753002.1 hypothetical protein AMSG_11024 [Thecamonas trahens ATCC 50062]
MSQGTFFTPQAPRISQMVATPPGSAPGRQQASRPAAGGTTADDLEGLEAMVAHMSALGEQSSMQRSELDALESQLAQLQEHRNNLTQLQSLLESNKDEQTISLVANYLETLVPSIEAAAEVEAEAEAGASAGADAGAAYLAALQSQVQAQGDDAEFDDDAEPEDANALYEQYMALMAEKQQLEAMRDMQIAAQQELRAATAAAEQRQASPSPAKAPRQASAPPPSAAVRRDIFSPAKPRASSQAPPLARSSSQPLTAEDAANMPVEDLAELRKAHLLNLRWLQEQLVNQQASPAKASTAPVTAAAAPAPRREASREELDEDGIYNLLATVQRESSAGGNSVNILDQLAAQWSQLQSQYTQQRKATPPQALSASFAASASASSPAEAPRPARAASHSPSRSAQQAHAPVPGPAFEAQAAEMEALQARIGGLYDMLGATRDDIAAVSGDNVFGAYAAGEDGSVSEADSLSTRFLEDELYASNIKLQDLQLAVSYAKSLSSRAEQKAFFKDFVRYFSDSQESESEAGHGSDARASGVPSGAAAPDVLSLDSAHPAGTADLLATLNAELARAGSYSGGHDDGDDGASSVASVGLDSAVYEAAVQFIVRVEDDPSYVSQLFTLLAQFDTPLLRVRVLASLDRLLHDVTAEAAYLDEHAPKVGAKRHPTDDDELRERSAETRTARKRARKLKKAPPPAKKERPPRTVTFDAPLAAGGTATVDDDPTTTVIRNKIMEEMHALDQINYFIQSVQDSPNKFAVDSPTTPRAVVTSRPVAAAPVAAAAAPAAAAYDYAESVNDDEPSLASEDEGESPEDARFYEATRAERHVSITPEPPTQRPDATGELSAADSATASTSQARAMEDELAAARAELEYHQSRKAALEARRADLLAQQQAIVDMARSAGIDPAALGLDLGEFAGEEAADEAVEQEAQTPAEGDNDGGDGDGDGDDESTTSSMEATMNHILTNYHVDVYINDALLTEFGNLFKALAAMPESGGKFNDVVRQILEGLFAEFKYTKLNRPVDTNEFAAFSDILARYSGMDIAVFEEDVLKDLKDMLFTHLITLSLTDQLADEEATRTQLQAQATAVAHQQRQTSPPAQPSAQTQTQAPAPDNDAANAAGVAIEDVFSLLAAYDQAAAAQSPAENREGPSHDNGSAGQGYPAYSRHLEGFLAGGADGNTDPAAHPN